MIFNLMAEGEGLSVGAVVALIICGVAVLAVAIVGNILKARDTSKKSKRAKSKSAQASETPAPTVTAEYDFTNLTEEEKNLIRKHRDGIKQDTQSK